MSSKRPRIRGHARARNSPYQLGEIPDEIVKSIGRLIVHRLAVGHSDITGDDFGGIFAFAISGEHLLKPFGVTDIIWNGCSWSAKTVKSPRPFTQDKVRLISGRNSPTYSYDISDSFTDLKETGAAVLNIWNERVNQSLHEHDDLRVIVLIRNMDLLEFTLFEYAAGRYPPLDYEWKLNKRRNFEGYECHSGVHRFTWQPSGSQFTVLKPVPGSAYKFRIIKHPGIIEVHRVLKSVGFNDNWIERVE